MVVTSRRQAAGSMFWFTRKKFVESSDVGSSAGPSPVAAGPRPSGEAFAWDLAANGLCGGNHEEKTVLQAVTAGETLAPESPPSLGPARPTAGPERGPNRASGHRPRSSPSHGSNPTGARDAISTRR
jgi:hypothetical protein